MIPSVTFQKSDGNTGAVRQSTDGVLAVLAPSGSGTPLQPGTFTRQADLLGAVGLGALVEYGGYHLQNAKKPVLAIKANASIAATTSALVKSIAGSSVPTATGTPVDEYEITVEILSAGTIGVAGITYRYTLDNGGIWSGTMSLLTANAIPALVVPRVGLSSGIGFSLGAGTLVKGDTWSCTTKGAQMNSADLEDALEALRLTRLPWEGVLVDGECSASSVSIVDSWLSQLESKGVFKMAWLNTRHKNRPVPTGESEATFAAAMGTLRAQIASTIRIDVGSDGGDVPSAVTGLSQFRPTSLATATRALSNAVGVDPASAALGALPGFKITDSSGNPKWHDEALFPGLDDMGFTSLRSMNDEDGVFIDNANILSPSASDYVYDQHARTMNKACAAAFARLQIELSKGVRKQRPDPQTGEIYILDADAAAIEVVVTSQLRKLLKKQVNDVAFTLSRNDDLSSNDGATVNCEVQLEALAYIKNFAVTAKFVRSISVPIG